MKVVEMLGITPNTSKTELYQAKKLLRKKINSLQADDVRPAQNYSPIRIHQRSHRGCVCISKAGKDLNICTVR